MGVRGLLTRVQRFAKPSAPTKPDGTRDTLLVDGSSLVYAALGSGGVSAKQPWSRSDATSIGDVAQSNIGSDQG